MYVIGPKCEKLYKTEWAVWIGIGFSAWAAGKRISHSHQNYQPRGSQVCISAF